MVSEVELYLIRAEDEFLLASTDMKLSTDAETKKKLGVPIEKTFFHSVISHSYYSIFYSAKAYLLNKRIKTKVPNEHKKTYLKLKKLVRKGILSEELLKIYINELEKADNLLEIFKTEKGKRGTFTYNIKSEANQPYAQESINNAQIFVSSIKSIIENQSKEKEELN